MRWAAMALLGLSTAAGAQPPAADPFCADLARVIRASGERPAFASIPPFTGAGGLAWLGFPANCGRTESVDGVRAFRCMRQLPGEKLRVDPLAAQILRCLPTAERLADTGRESMFRDHVVRLRAPGVTIELAEGGWRTAGGGRVELAIRPAP